MSNTLYRELMSNIGKEASTDFMKNGIEDLDNDQLIALAGELASLSGDEDLAEMARILPVYASGSPGGQSEHEINIEQKILNTNPDPIPEEEPLVTGPGGEADAVINVTASANETDMEVESATSILYQILKEGAELEEMVEKRAYEMANDMTKEATEFAVARELLDGVAARLAGTPQKALDYSNHMMEQARTVAAKTTVPIVDAAHAVASEVMAKVQGAGSYLGAVPANPLTRGEAIANVGAGIGVGAIGGNIYGSNKEAFSVLDELAKESYAVENYYEKIAEAIGETAEALITQYGVSQGLADVKLFDFVQKEMLQVKTLAAKQGTNLAQAAQAYLAGIRGTVTGSLEPIVPSPSQMPSAVKAPINSNQTQSPDAVFPQMLANVDPQAVALGAQVKAAAMDEMVKNLLKEAMLAELQNG